MTDKPTDAPTPAQPQPLSYEEAHAIMIAPLPAITRFGSLASWAGQTPRMYHKRTPADWDERTDFRVLY
jgi:hypothetical protein